MINSLALVYSHTILKIPMNAYVMQRTSMGIFHYTPHSLIKVNDWLKRGHMAWISFGNVHAWKLIHVC